MNEFKEQIINALKKYKFKFIQPDSLYKHVGTYTNIFNIESMLIRFCPLSVSLEINECTEINIFYQSVTDVGGDEDEFNIIFDNDVTLTLVIEKNENKFHKVEFRHLD